MERKTRTKSPDARDADVGRRIRAQRLVCNMSQTELGNRVGITFQQIQKYEKGVNRVGAGRLARIADVLKVPVAYFFAGDDTPSDSGDSVNAGLSFLETAGAVRLARAYSQIEDAHVRRALVELAEELAGRKTRKPRKGAAAVAVSERGSASRGRSLKA